MTKVPCRVEKIHSSSPDFVRRLREYNRQREKTLDERLREEIVSVDIATAHQSLVEHREQASAFSADVVELKDMKRGPGSVVRRSRCWTRF